jgi:hypothetical protein
MQIGCGVYTQRVRGRSYLYLWHYETSAGHRRQIKEYLGSAGAEDVRAEAIHRVDSYFRRAARELSHLRRETLTAIARAR